MALSPLDIHHKEFKTARFGGYNEEEVDSFLDLVADELDNILQENNDLRLQMQHLKQRLAEFEEMQSSLQSALLAATRSAEAVKEQARQESETIMLKTQKEAELLIGSADEQARQIHLKGQEERQKLEQSYAQLKNIKRHYLQSIKEIADAHLAQVAELEAREAIDAPVEELPFEAEKQPQPSGAQAAPKTREKTRPAATTRRQPTAPAPEAPLPVIEPKQEAAPGPRAPKPPAFVQDMPIVDVTTAPTVEPETATPPPEPVTEALPEPAPEPTRAAPPPEPLAAARIVLAPELETTAPPPAAELETTDLPYENRNAVPPAPAPEPRKTAPPPESRTEAPPAPAPETGVTAAPAAVRRQPVAREAMEGPIVEGPARVASRQAPVAPVEARRTTSEVGRVAATPASSNLVQEVLAVDMEDDIYSLLEEDDSDETRARGRKSRREKREKHFFWE